MDDSIFGSKLDFQKYIEKRLLEVTDLIQRRQLRETLEHVFMGLYEHIAGEYANLEQKILQEEDSGGQYLSIQTSMIPRDRYDATDEYLMPMDLKDIEKPQIDQNELTARIESGQPYRLYRVVLEADYRIVKALEKENKIFQGVIITDQGHFDAEFTVEKDNHYLKMIERLYPVFINNYQPWNTVCAPYINKVFCISLRSVADWDGDAKIQEIQINFEEFEKFVRYDCIPLWNLSLHVEKSSSYPEPCLDHVHYQHIIYRHRLQAESDYLVASTEYPLENVKRIKGDLFLTCKEEYPVKWLLYKLAKPSNRSYPYRVFTNAVKEDFSDALSHRFQATIKTKSELERFIVSQGYQDILKFITYRLESQISGEVESYHTDYFVADEFQTAGNRMILLLIFEAVRLDDIFIRDIMSYLVTQVQKKFPEYRCIGQIN